MKRSNRLKNVTEESHYETLTRVNPTPTLTLAPALTPKMVKVYEIRNIMHEVLRKHQEMSINVGHATKAPIASV